MGLLIRTYFLLIFALCGCAPNPQLAEEAEPKPALAQFIARSGHSPPFARTPFAPFSRVEAVAIAQQEWRLFGQRVDDDPPRSGPDREVGDDPARAPGLWERIGEYWWLGQDVDRRESAWTGMYDENGQEIDPQEADYYAWSAAFISYVMRTAGAGARFPYAPAHYVYINIGKEMKLGRTSGWGLVAERADEYPPIPGDLICFSRERRPLNYDRLPRRHFAGHCDIVVARDTGEISVIGGNVDHAVTMKHVPATADGRIAERDGRVLDTRYPWFVVLRILYDR